MAPPAMIPHHNHLKVMISLGYSHFRSIGVHDAEGVVPREPKSMEKIPSANFVLAADLLRRKCDFPLSHAAPHK
jgi:hypothetical protein